MTTNCDPMRAKVFTCWSRAYIDDDWRCHARTGLAHMYLLWGCCFGDGGSTILGYDYLELYGANAQNTCRRIHRSYCSQPIHTKRCYWAVFLKRIESRTLKTMKALYALYAKYANVLVVKRTLVEKIKFLNLKPNCIYSMQSTEQHNYRETEEQNSNGANCLWRKTLCWIHFMLRNEATITVRMVLISRSERWILCLFSLQWYGYSF